MAPHHRLNRDKIMKLASDSAKTDDVTGPGEALNAVNPLREQAMVNRIVAAGAPLFVQIDQAHVGRVGAELRKRGGQDAGAGLLR